MRKGIRSIKRGTAVLLSACMVFGMTPIQAGAEEVGTGVSGNETQIQTEPSESGSETQTQAEPSESDSDAQTQAEPSGSGSDNETAEAAEAGHYDENGFCKGYEIDPNGSGAWVKKSGADACTDADCNGYQPMTTETEDDTEWYEISNAGQLYWFALQADNGKLLDANVRLTADIVDNEGVTFGWDENNDYAVVATKDGQAVDTTTLRMWNPIGEKQNDENHMFAGHFDGQGHTVSGLYYDSQDMNKDAGIFWRVYGTSACYTIIERVGLENSYLHSRKGAGGITGYAHCASIRQCYNAAYLVSAYYSGGIVALTSDRITLSEVFNFGETMLIGSSNQDPFRGQIIGKRGADSKDGAKYELNCCYARSDLNIDLCGNNSDYNVEKTFLPKESFYNGEVAYLLSQSSATWGQDLSSDNSLPNPCVSEEYKVYKTCTGYTNDAREVHHIVKNGFCTNAGCNYYEEPHYNETEGVYEISNAGQLYAYADKAQIVYTKGARLTADIVVNEEALIQEDGTPVTETADIRMWDGLFRYLYYLYDNEQKLVFDGNNHSISGLYARGSGLQGFALYNNGTVKNLQIKNSVFISTNGSAGGIVAGPPFGKGDCKLVNCSFEGYVEGAKTAGGIVGYINDLVAGSHNISNCYVDAYVKGGTVNPIAPYKATISNTAYNTDKYTAGCITKNVTGFTTDQFASGEVAYALNNGNSDIWKQTLDGEAKDSTPTLNTAKANVYQYERLRCDGTEKTTDDGKYVYTNDSTMSGKQIQDEHVYEIDPSDHTHHKCKVCGDEVAHDYTYKVADGTTDTIRAVCDVCGDSYTVKLSAPAGADGKLTYTGTELTAGTDITDGTLGETLPGVEYATVTDGNVSAYSTDAPVNAGSYRARLTMGSGDNAVSATVDYTIEQATPVIGWADEQKEQSAVYTGTAIASSKLTAPKVTLLGNDTFSDSSKITYSYRKVTDSTASGDFISGLPADVGTYEIKASIPADGNYTAAEGTMTLEIKWLDLNNIAATLIDEKGKMLDPDTEWWATSVSFTAPEGYTICKTVDGTYGSSFTYADATDDKAKEITYYLKNEAGEIGEKSVTVRIADPNNCSHVDKKSTDSKGNETNEPDGFCDKCGTSLKNLEHLADLYRTISNELNNSEGKYNGTQYTTKSIENLRQALKTASSMTAQNSVDEITTAYDNLLRASRVGNDGLIAADHNIVISFANPGAVRGIASGNGWYANGDTVTLKVTPSMGYSFSKWTTDTAGNTFVGTESTYTFTLDADSQDAYYAWLDEVKYTVTCESVEGGTCTTSTSDGKYVYGQTATVTATANDDYEFVGWKDSYGITVSTDAAYSFTVIGDTALTPEFVKAKTEEGNEIAYVTVSLYHQSGKLLDSRKVVSGEGKITTTVNAPTKVGFDFLGWSAKASGATAEDVVDFETATFSENTSFYPVFEAQNITYTLTVGLQTEQKAPQSSVTVTADPMEGKQFVGWKDANGNIVSYDSTYTFIITGDTTLEAYYEQADGEVVKEPTIIIGEPTYEDITGGYKMAFYFNYTVSEDCKLLDIGIIRKKGDYTADGITLETDGMSQYSVLSKLGSEGQFYYTKSNYYGTGHTVTGYMIYEKNGIRYTVYSDSIYGVKNK